MHTRLGWTPITALALALAAATASPAAAQFTIGIKGGANFTDLADVESTYRTSSETKFAGGLYAAIGFGGSWSIQPELLYSQHGATVSDAVDSALLTEHYVEIPLLLNIRLLQGIVEPQIYLGPSISFPLACELTEDGETEDCGDVVDDFESSSALWAGIAGVALDFDLGPLVLGVDGRYNYGFSEIHEVSDIAESKWRYFSLMAEIGIALGR
jgi:hypothetical protein